MSRVKLTTNVGTSAANRQANGFTRTGSVVRISLKNFMTYHEATVRPGSSFNVTVGPNGSGKSTIVSALCLCLGGDLTNLNRQCDLDSFINSSQTGHNAKAVVDVELFGLTISWNGDKFTVTEDSAHNVVVTTIIKGNVSPPSQEWYIDEKPVTKDKLLEVMNELQIQPNNMCQFLPQDVVREFPSMTPNTVLYNTIKAVGENSILETYNKLEENMNLVDSLSEDVKTKERTYTSLRNKNEKNAEFCRKYEAKKKLEEKLHLMNGCIKWRKFKNIQIAVKKAKTQKEEANEELKRMVQKMEDKDLEVKAAVERVEQSEARKKIMDTKFMKASESVQSCFNEMKDCEDAVARLEHELSILGEQEEARLKKLKQLPREIEELEKLLKDNPISKLVEKKRQTKNEMNERQQELENFVDLRNELSREIHFQDKEMEKLDAELQQLNNLKELKYERLRRCNNDAYRAEIWLQNNRHVFQGKIYGPIMMCLQVKEERFFPYLEKHIGRSELEGFVCEVPDDSNRLVLELQKIGLHRINAFSQPENFTYSTPEIPEECSENKFVSFLSEMYDAPFAVHAYLCQMKNLNKIPLFERESDKLSKHFWKYFVGQDMFSISRSKYTKIASTKVDPVDAHKMYLLKGVENVEAVDRLKLDIRNVMSKKDDLSSKKKEQENRIQSINHRLNSLEAQFKDLDARERNLTKARHTLSLKKDALQHSQCSISEHERKEKQESLKIDMRNKVKELITEFNRLPKALEKAVKYDRRREVANWQVRVLKYHHASLRADLDTLTQAEDDFRKEVEEIAKAFKEKSGSLKEALDKAVALTGADPDNKTRAPENYLQQHKELLEEYKNDMTLLEHCYESELEQFQKDYKDITEEKIKEIEKTKEKLDQSRKEVEEIQGKVQELKASIESMRETFNAKMKDLISKVDVKFSELMGELGYSGMVIFDQEPSENGFQRFGIRIKVKFRSSQENFQDFGRDSQSGGEKSVSTAVYMMALQELTKVPFRCVDEINQGMDERNERLIWNLLLQICSKYKAQYFYMVPKFPYNLHFNEQVTVLMCHNGDVSKSNQANIDVKRFREVAKIKNENGQN